MFFRCVDVRNGCLKQFSHQLLRQPNGIIFKPDIKLCVAVFGLIDDDLRIIWAFHTIAYIISLYRAIL